MESETSAISVNEFIFKVVILGNIGAGKTSLLHRYCRNNFKSNYKCTIGTDVLTKNLIIDDGRKKITLQIWDTSGQERFRSLNSLYFRGADACILLFDLTNYSSYEDIESWQNEFMINANPPMPNKFPFILIGNKVDEAILKRQVRARVADKWAMNHDKMPYVETSAKDNLNVEHAFRVLTTSILNYVELMDTYELHRAKQNNVHLDDPSDRNSGGCC